MILLRSFRSRHDFCLTEKCEILLLHLHLCNLFNYKVTAGLFFLSTVEPNNTFYRQLILVQSHKIRENDFIFIVSNSSRLNFGNTSHRVRWWDIAWDRLFPYYLRIYCSDYLYDTRWRLTNDKNCQLWRYRREHGELNLYFLDRTKKCRAT